MSKAKFAAAKELIDEKKYDEALTILKTIDHPTAREWEAKLAKIKAASSGNDEPYYGSKTDGPVRVSTLQPTNKPSQTLGNRYIYNVIRVIIFAFVVVVVVVVILSQVQKTAQEVAPAYIASGNALATTINPSPTTQISTATAPSKVANAATATSTSSPTVTPTSTPSPTITDTLTPSITPTSTVTPTNTVTPSPTRAPFGTKANPYPIGAPGAVRDGRMQVNQFARNQTPLIKQENQFNDDPPAGSEYVLAYITFYCDLPSTQTCTVTFMDLELTGQNGNIYKRELFVTMDNDFKGEVFGGGQLTGRVAFIVNSNDSKFTFIVNDLGSRTFFTAGG
jgi:hypothetical protein